MGSSENKILQEQLTQETRKPTTANITYHHMCQGKQYAHYLENLTKIENEQQKNQRKTFFSSYNYRKRGENNPNHPNS